MKKVLLLALTIGSAAALTACGGATKEISNFLENHTNLFEESTVVNNYTVAVSGSTFKVDGNLASLNGSNDFYELNEDGTASYWYDESFWERSSDADYTNGVVTVLNRESLTATELKAHTAASNALSNPFATLLNEEEGITAEKLYKEFATEEDENGVVTFFYVDSKEVKTAADSSFTVVFTYNLDAKEKATDEFATATVTTNNTTWVYSNLSNEDYEFGATAHSLSTPGTTMVENMVALVNAQDNMTVKYTYNYTTSADVAAETTVTATIDGDNYKLVASSSAVANQYVTKNADGTYTITAVDSGSWYVQETVATLAEVPMLEQLLAAMNHSAVDAGMVITGNLTTSQYGGTPRYDSDHNKLAIGDTHVQMDIDFWRQDGKTTIEVGTYTGQDSDYFYVDDLYQITALNVFDAESSLADEIAALNIVNEDFKTIVEMLTLSTSKQNEANYTYTDKDGKSTHYDNGVFRIEDDVTHDGNKYDSYYVMQGVTVEGFEHLGSSDGTKVYAAQNATIWSKNTQGIDAVGLGTSSQVGVTYDKYTSNGTVTIDNVDYLKFTYEISDSGGQRVEIYIGADLASSYVVKTTAITAGTNTVVTYTNFGDVEVTLPDLTAAPTPNTPATTEPDTTEPDTTEPDTTEPDTTEPDVE